MFFFLECRLAILRFNTSKCLCFRREYSECYFHSYFGEFVWRCHSEVPLWPCLITHHATETNYEAVWLQFSHLQSGSGCCQCCIVLLTLHLFCCCVSLPVSLAVSCLRVLSLVCYLCLTFFAALPQSCMWLLCTAIK